MPIPKEVEEWKKQKAEYDRQWGPLSSSMKGSAIDPLVIKCNCSPDNLLQSAIKALEGTHVTACIYCACICIHM